MTVLFRGVERYYRELVSVQYGTIVTSIHFHKHGIDMHREVGPTLLS
jgi:hypothetical protein